MAWMQIFSYFSSEMVLLELLILSFLVSVYAFLFVMKRYRLGLIESQIPAGPVKEVLTDFIRIAQGLEQELFGGGDAKPLEKPVIIVPKMEDIVENKEPVSLNTEMLAQIKLKEEEIEALKAKILMLEKLNTENQVQNALDPKEFEMLKEKVQIFQDRLDEYAIIEDDLVNLKGILKENDQLREQVKKFLNQMDSASPDSPVIQSEESIPQVTNNPSSPSESIPEIKN